MKQCMITIMTITRYRTTGNWSISYHLQCNWELRS